MVLVERLALVAAKVLETLVHFVNAGRVSVGVKETALDAGAGAAQRLA